MGTIPVEAVPLEAVPVGDPRLSAIPPQRAEQWHGRLPRDREKRRVRPGRFTGKMPERMSNTQARGQCLSMKSCDRAPTIDEQWVAASSG